MDFEETEKKLAANVASLGFDLPSLARRKKLLVEYVSVERHEIAETGEYNLDGLFIRLGQAVKAINGQTRGPRQHRGPVLRFDRLNVPAIGTQPAVSLAGGSRSSRPW